MSHHHANPSRHNPEGGIMKLVLVGEDSLPRSNSRILRLAEEDGIDEIAGVARFAKPNLEYQIGWGIAGMGRLPAKDLTERELEVMHAFWRHGEATAAEARGHLAVSGLDRTYSTIANLVRGLAEKGFLRQVNKDKPFRYRVVRSYEDVSGRLLRDLVGRVFRGSRAQLLKRLVEQRALTAEERDLLEQILKEQGQ
jgi:BlaI family transcriptional regulator, penicillinase repressor